jgi:AraC-like DNA-binding protein
LEEGYLFGNIWEILIKFDTIFSQFLMNILNKYGILLLFLFISNVFYTQNSDSLKNLDYSELRSRYENKEENDEKALPFVKIYLKKAKEEKAFPKIFQGYKDFIFYTKDRHRKLLYADSCVTSALLSKNDELISHAYLTKGIIYYFFYKKYQPALDEYLKAYEHSREIKNSYLKYRVIYQMGVVKSYLGYYDDALKLFNECADYFEPLTKADIHPNLIFNNQKGYFNSLHQKIICYHALGDFSKSDSLLRVGLTTLPKSKEFNLERAYFNKCLGISNFRQKKYPAAIRNFSDALPELNKIDDFTWLSVSSFYTGKAFYKINKHDKALPYFIKVDSIFKKENFILPEIRENYEILIDYYHKNKNPERELFYTKRLLKADSILNTDFKYLSSKIHREYDTKALLDKQEELEGINYISFSLLILASVLIISLVIILIFRKRKENKIQRKYELLEMRILEKEQQLAEKPDNLILVENNDKMGVPVNIIQDLLQKLKDFERKKEFKKRKTTLSEMAKKFETNTTYLSFVINEYLHKNFNTYLNELRINYITEKLYHEPKYLNYTVEGLTKDCGFSSRQTFSDIFYEINGIRPGDFIRKRRTELKEMSA